MQTATAKDALELLERQKNNWPMCGENYRQLDQVRVRAFDYNGLELNVQFNPGRIRSTSAKVDSKSIKERKCFLCRENRPPEQEELQYDGNFLILVNPFPIFSEHFTIAHSEHVLQEFRAYIPEMTAMARDIGEKLTVFYNGPRCGASAPDHMHFQAGTKNFMPVDREWETLIQKYGLKVKAPDADLYTVDDGIRKIFAIESAEKTALDKTIQLAYDAWKTASGGDEEPLLNAHIYRAGDKLRTLLFLREKHRPARYFAEGKEQLMLSPAAVDIGGASVIPVEEHFNRITKEDLVDMLREVFPGSDRFTDVTGYINSGE